MRVGTAFVCLGIDSDAFWRIQPHERTRACVSKYERLTCVSKYERLTFVSKYERLTCVSKYERLTFVSKYERLTFVSKYEMLTCVSKYERLTCVSKYERFFLRRNVLQDIDHPQTTQVTSCCEILRVWSQLCSILQLHL